MTSSAPATPPQPPTAPAGLALRLRQRPEAPLLTWYDLESGERIELSTATFANWVAKTANLLRDGIGVPDRPRVAIDLPAHWQAFPIAYAVWSLEGTVVLRSWHDEVEPVDLVVRSAASAAATWQSDDELILALRPLGAPGATVATPAYDYDREVPVYADAFAGPVVDPHAAALDVDGDITSQRGLIDAAVPRTGTERELVHSSTRSLAQVLPAVLAGALSQGVVIAVGAADEDVIERIGKAERVTS